jgi:8-oxo-dGTP pyrophosphatase MutT (NUDIX family)|tara:strand:- start:2016 stop:2420 length:405 start_codon:yes stop_codon:yes gene_type:complete
MGIATKAIIIKNKKYLLQHRDDKKNIFSPNHWGCFGGMIDEKKETAEQGIRRELKEELSINFEILKKLHEGFHEPSGTKNIFFLAKPISNTQLIDLKEGQNYGWFKIEEVKKLKITWDTKYIFDYLTKDFNYIQ